MSYYLIYGIHVIYKNIWKVAVFKGFEINIFLNKGFRIKEEGFLFDDDALNNRKETAQYYYILER